MIVSSIISQADPQIDGRTVVREVHTDDLGQTYIFDYMADVGMDINQRLADRAAELNAQLAGG